MKRKIIPDPLLMLVSVFVIIIFQAYWLKDSFEREKKSLQLNATVAFQETVHQLQSLKFKLPSDFNNAIPGGRSGKFLQQEATDTLKSADNLIRHKVIAVTNTIRYTIIDSLKAGSKAKITRLFRKTGETGKLTDSRYLLLKKDKDSFRNIVDMLYRLDSLQVSIPVNEIAAAYSARLKRENLMVPFTIKRWPGRLKESANDISKVTIGFANPKTYELLLGSTGDYLLKNISLPIMFSLLLISVTILSFIVLYRTLLRQQRLAEIKNDFISNITHELKTPLATVGVAIEALRNFNALQDPQKTKEYLDASSRELQGLSLLVDKVLTLSMFEKKEMSLNKEIFDLRELIRQVIESTKPQFEKKKATVSFKSTGDYFFIKADKLHLTSVLYNLLDNAIKYSRENLVINLELQQTYIRKQCLFSLKVSDNGIGIAREDSRKVFEKFFRVPAGNMHTVKGYGLGLSYVAEIIKRHFGYVYVESELGKGSNFIIKLPAEESAVIWFDDKRSLRRQSFDLFKKKNYEP